MDEKSFSSIDWSSIRYYISQNKLQNFQRQEKKAENLLSSNDAYKSIWVNEYKIDKNNMKQEIWSKEKHKTDVFLIHRWIHWIHHWIHQWIHRIRWIRWIHWIHWMHYWIYWIHLIHWAENQGFIFPSCLESFCFGVVCICVNICIYIYI